MTVNRLDHCAKCHLSIYSNFRPVPGMGNPDADIMFIGEAPGYKENKEKKPFVGVAGRHLRKFVNLFNLDEVSYFTNAVKSRPPKNRTPRMDEILKCRFHLTEELKVVKPKVIVLLGNTAVNSLFLNEVNSISKLNGKMMYSRKYKAIIMFMYHPSYIIRNREKDPLYMKNFVKLTKLYMKINRFHEIQVNI
jgi:uracil-DNA glycosylase